MSLFGKKEKKEIERLKQQMSPDQIEAANLQARIEEYNKQIAKLQKQVLSEESKLEATKKRVSAEEAKLAGVKAEIVETNEAVLLQTFGFFTPHYLYELSDDYKAALTKVRDEQKDMVRLKGAITGATDWTVNGNRHQGEKMVSDIQKLLLRAFNAECDDAIEHVKFNNYESSLKKIEKSYEAISKLGTTMKISITPRYYNLKTKELRLMHEYRLKKQDEKDASRAARERMREEVKLAKELEEARKKLEKEQTHYTNALKKINLQLASSSPEERADIEAKKAEIEQHLQTIDREFQDVDYRAANQRAGYVYIISNIGAFGEGVYKIGMTRRLDPMDRVDELGDASVPFDFDVHAMIFSEDAPSLESALHKAFEDRKLNMVNTRREFFRVSLDEIKQVVKKNFDKSVEFVDVASAEQYRESLVLRNQMSMKE